MLSGRNSQVHKFSELETKATSLPNPRPLIGSAGAAVFSAFLKTRLRTEFFVFLHATRHPPPPCCSMGGTPISSNAVRRRARRRQPSFERRGPPASAPGRARLDMAADSTSAPPPRDRVEPPGGSAANPKKTPPHACGGVHLRVAARADAAARAAAARAASARAAAARAAAARDRPRRTGAPTPQRASGSSHRTAINFTWRILFRIRPYFQKGHYGPYSTYSIIFVAFLTALLIGTAGQPRR